MNEEIKAKIANLVERTCEISSMFCIVTTAVRDNSPDSATADFNRSLPAALELLQRSVDSVWTDLESVYTLLDRIEELEE